MKFMVILMFFLINTGNLTYAATVPSDASIENAILVQINAYRISHHLKPLKMDSRISKEAKKHSSDMAKYIVPVGHQSFANRISRLRLLIKNVTAAGENVAFGYRTAQDVVKGWINSPGHRNNILGNYNLTGIGVARDVRGRIYFTQIFLKGTTTP